VIFPPYVAVCVAGATAPDWLEYAISAVVIIICMTVTHLTGSSGRSGPQFSDMTLSGRSVLIVPNNTGTDYD